MLHHKNSRVWCVLATLCGLSCGALVLVVSLDVAPQASEYHLYYAMLKVSICTDLQATIVPKGVMTPTHELDGSNPKTIWWAWCPDAPTHQIEELLAQQAANTPHADDGMDFSKSLKLGSPGQQVRDEVECAQRLRADTIHRARERTNLGDISALNSFVQSRSFDAGNASSSPLVEPDVLGSTAMNAWPS